jgi:triosephosphate isomerase
MRQRLIVGNWKMFTTAATARRLAADVVGASAPKRASASPSVRPPPTSASSVRW